MTEYFIREETLKELADVIRDKFSTTEELSLDEMIELIRNHACSNEESELWAFLSQTVLTVNRTMNPFFIGTTLDLSEDVPVQAFLQNFEYTYNNGIYTILGWKENENTELIIPNNGNIIL